MADREKIAHVVANLLGNAIEFTPSGGRVWVRASRSPNEPVASLLVEVGDTGVGISAEHHDLIFREFAQVDATASRPHHGTGLGLTIARKLVELHGGRIWVESRLGSGSRFYFSVPFEQLD
jgi:signal transduction histidine kinase